MVQGEHRKKKLKSGSRMFGAGLASSSLPIRARGQQVHQRVLGLEFPSYRVSGVWAKFTLKAFLQVQACIHVDLHAYIYI